MNSGAKGELDCYRCIHHQGSNTMMVFNNVLTPYSGKSTSAMEFLHYRSWESPYCDGTTGGRYQDGSRSPSSTWHGYPCFHQPGRDVNGKYMPMYSWNNKWSDGTIVNLDYGDAGGNPDYSSTHIVQNRDYYTSVSANAQSSPTSPFNGTTGVGFGASANQPTNCTTSSETAYGNGAAGVGYAVETVTGTIGAAGNGEGTPTNATVNTCSATNTWSAYYAPYAYPHPLVSGGASPVGPAAPTNLTVTVH
jgi:hypothetical protein